MRNLYLLIIIVFLSLGNVAQAQSIKDILFDKPGLQIGMYQVNTSASDVGFNYHFRLYNNHSYVKDRFGEISVASGIMSGLGYRSQLTSLEYRFGQHFARLFDDPEPGMFGKRKNLFVYAGAGLLYNRPLEVVAPDDPLTVEMGAGLPTSSFWDFEGGFAPIIPVGMGLEVPLDVGAKFNVSVGYNQTLSMLKFNDNEVPKGYWNFSIGIDFKTERPKAAPSLPPPSVPAFRSFQATPVAVAELKPVEVKPVQTSDALLAKLNEKTVHFETLSSTIDEEGLQWISEVASILKQYPNRPLQVFGHADSQGDEAINSMISESRARAVWLALIDQGISTSRLNYNWHSDDQPLAANNTEEGRQQNRRVEFKTVPSVESERRVLDSSKAGTAASVVQNYDLETPLFDGEEIYFYGGYLKVNEVSASVIESVAYLLLEEPELEMVILSQGDSWTGPRLKRALAKSRADLIRAELIIKGVDEGRVHTAAPGTELYQTYSTHFKGNGQQNLLIPIPANSVEGQ